MSAQPSDGAFDVASRWQGHRFNCAIYGDHDLPDTSCTCIVRELAAAIDSHVRAGVERERERQHAVMLNLVRAMENEIDTRRCRDSSLHALNLARKEVNAAIRAPKEGA